MPYQNDYTTLDKNFDAEYLDKDKIRNVTTK